MKSKIKKKKRYTFRYIYTQSKHKLSLFSLMFPPPLLCIPSKFKNILDSTKQQFAWIYNTLIHDFHLSIHIEYMFSFFFKKKRNLVQPGPLKTKGLLKHENKNTWKHLFTMNWLFERMMNKIIKISFTLSMHHLNL